MSRVILKFKLDPLITNQVQKVEVPSMEYQPQILDIQFQTSGLPMTDYQELVFWVETNVLYLAEKKTEQEEFILRFTGSPFEQELRKRFLYLKTLEHKSGYIFHIYKRLWDLDFLQGEK